MYLIQIETVKWKTLPGQQMMTGEKFRKGLEQTFWSYLTFFRCADLFEIIPWKNNVNFPNDCTIASAIEYGKRDEDNGIVGNIILMPKDDTCSAWLDYLGYLAFMHERYNLGVNH